MPEVIDGSEEFEVEEILSHQVNHKRTEYLVRFVGYGPEDDLWLPERNLANATTILQRYKDRQDDQEPPHTSHPARAGRAPRHLTWLGHIWFSKCVGLPEDWQTPRMG